MKSIKGALVALVVAMAIALGSFVSQTASAAGPPSDVNWTANVQFVLKANQASLTCYLHNRVGAPLQFCSSAGQFGIVRTDEIANRFWFVAPVDYALPTGRVEYQAKGHTDYYYTWFGGKQPLVRYIGGIRYHLTGGWILVLRAQH